MKFKLISAFFLTLSLFSFQASARAVPMMDFENIPLSNSNGVTPTIEQVKTAILSVAKGRGWDATPQVDNKIVLHYSKKDKNHVTVEVSYTATTMSIKYKDSINMNYRAEGAIAQIHPAYNTWVNNIKRDVLDWLRRI